MSKRLPFDTYVIRKVQKWQKRAEEWGVDLIDAVGVSPMEEMIYFWSQWRLQPMRERESSTNARVCVS